MIGLCHTIYHSPQHAYVLSPSQDVTAADANAGKKDGGVAGYTHLMLHVEIFHLDVVVVRRDLDGTVMRFVPTHHLWTMEQPRMFPFRGSGGVTYHLPAAAFDSSAVVLVMPAVGLQPVWPAMDGGIADARPRPAGDVTLPDWPDCQETTAASLRNRAFSFRGTACLSTHFQHFKMEPDYHAMIPISLSGLPAPLTNCFATQYVIGTQAAAAAMQRALDRAPWASEALVCRPMS